VTTADVFARLASDLETRSGVPCGNCGLPHQVDDARPSGEACTCCPPCARRLVDNVVAELIQLFPDLVPPSTSIVSAATLEECIRRMEAEIARLDREEAEWHRREAERAARLLR
jgi:hypothetical protein